MKKYLALLLAFAFAAPAFGTDRNTSGQYIELQAIDTATGAPKTGDSANLTGYVSGDGDTTPDALTDTSATELSSTNAPGVYRFDLTSGETNFINAVYTAKSSTSGVYLIPRYVTLMPAGMSTLTIANNATAANVTRYGGTAGTFASGIPAVNATQVSGDTTAADNLESAYDGTGYNDPRNTAGPRTWYLDPDSDGAGDLGTYAAPFDTWAQADAVLQDGDTIFLLAGTYSTTTTYTVSKKNVTIVGCGDASILSFANASASAAAIQGVDGTTLRNFVINCTNNGKGYYGGGTPCQRLEGMQVNGKSEAVNLSDSQKSLVDGCVLYSNGTGVQYGHENFGAQILDSIITVGGSHSGAVAYTGVMAGDADLRMENSSIYTYKDATDTKEVYGISAGGFGTGSLGTLYLEGTAVFAQDLNTLGAANGRVIALYLSSRAESACSATVQGGVLMAQNQADPTAEWTAVESEADASSVVRTFGTYADSTKVSGSVRIVDGEVLAVKTKTDFLPSVTAGNSGGVFIAGTNAATTVNLTGSLSGSVGSVAGAVGSVTAGVTLANDSITAEKFDESTAYPVKSADTGSTQIARKGADDVTLSDVEGGGGGGDPISPFLLTPAHSWKFDNPTQITSPNILLENTGFTNLLFEMDLSGAISNSAAVQSIDSVTVADVSMATEPTVVSSTRRTDLKAVHIKMSAVGATAGRYTISVQFTTTDGQQLVRKGLMTIQ